MVFWLLAQCSYTDWCFGGRRGSFSSDVLSVINFKLCLFVLKWHSSVQWGLSTCEAVIPVIAPIAPNARRFGPGPVQRHLSSFSCYVPASMFVQVIYQLLTEKGICFCFSRLSHALNLVGVNSILILYSAWPNEKGNEDTLKAYLFQRCFPSVKGAFTRFLRWKRSKSKKGGKTARK